MLKKMQNAAVRSTPRATTGVLCLPSAVGNPYQTLFYTNATPDFDVTFASASGLDQLEQGEFGVLHLHWDDRMFGRDPDTAENRAALDAALHKLRAFKAQGGRILWTIHNRAPHKARDLETFESARTELTRLADVIHVHAPHAAEHMQKTYGAKPSQLCVIPHPSYLGAYEPAQTTFKRKLSRTKKRQFLFFGMFRGEKGIHAINAAAQKLTRRDWDYALGMYGKAFASQKRLLRQLEDNPNIDLRTDRIPDNEIPTIFGKAHVFLAPYASLFSSGSVMLAQTFGLPIIGPDIRELREITPPECHDLLYDPAAPRGLLRMMMRVIEMDLSDLKEHREACLAFALDRSPEAASKALVKQMSPPARSARSGT